MGAGIAALVDRCLLVWTRGTQVGPRYARWLGEGLGGVLLFKQNLRDAGQARDLCRELREAAAVDLLIAMDEEGGDVAPLHAAAGSPHPGNLALGAIDDVALTRAVATDIGGRLAEIGVNLDLAPVADLSARSGAFIGTRSFGSDPALVERHVAAYVAGLQSTGVAACAKHFPGHGQTTFTRREEFPVAGGEPEEQLRPFRAAIAAGVACLLTAHVVHPTLDPRPATISPPVLYGLLRERLGFSGVIVTDALPGPAMTATVGGPESAVLALAAGADLLCLIGRYAEQRAIRDHVVAAVSAGRLPESRLVEAAGRVSALARAHARPAGTPSDVSGAARWTPALGQRLLMRDCPTPVDGPPYVIDLVGPPSRMEPDSGSLLDALRRYDPYADGVRLTEPDGPESAPDPALPDDLLEPAYGRPLLLVVRDAHRDARQRARLEALRRDRPDAVVVGIGAPDDAGLAPGRYLGTRGGALPNLDAAARHLLGR